MSRQHWIDQELLYLDQIRMLFKVCACADRLLDCQNEFGLASVYCSEHAEALAAALAALQAARFYDRAQGKAQR